MSNLPDPALAKKFFEDQNCVLAEASQSYLQNVKNCFKTMGVEKINFFNCKKYDEAALLIEKTKPRLLLSDFILDGKEAVGLLKLQQQHHDVDSKITIFTSNEAKDAEITKIAEEDVDALFLKPISIGNFQENLLSVIQRKVQPSPYAMKIRDGRNFVYEKKYIEALAQFQEAKTLHEKPSLACYYGGMTQILLSNKEGALQEFQQGQNFQPLHYKCLMAEFDLVFEKDDYEKAYQLIPDMTKNYSLSLKRLSRIFITTVFAKKFEDLPQYYELISKSTDKGEELTRIASHAFLVAGKWHLSKNQKASALDSFEKALAIGQRSIEILQQVIRELIQQNLVPEAEKFLEKVLPADVGTPIYNRIAFSLDLLTLRPEQLVEKARKLLQLGHANKENYVDIVRLFTKVGKKELAESTITKAVVDYPELRELLYKILEGKE